MEGLRIVNLAARLSAFLWILLTLALIGNMEAISSGPSIVNYCMFTSVWCMLTLLYLLPATFSDAIAFHWALPVSLDILNIIFSFVAAVALPAYLHVHSCTNYVSYLLKSPIYLY